MIKYVAAFVLIVGGAGAALAESDTAAPSRDDAAVSAGRSVSATGQTMPKVGSPRSEGTTDLDRGVQRRDDQIQRSICSNC